VKSARTVIFAAVLGVSVLGVAGLSPAQAAPITERYQRITVKKAGISILVPRDWTISKGPNGSWYAIGESGRNVSVGFSPGYGSSLPSPADVRAYLASVARQSGGPFESVTVKRTTVAKTPAVVQIVVASKQSPKLVSYFFQARGGRVVAIAFGRRATDDNPKFDEMSDTMIRSVRLVP
jgi:hypothetical protein